MPPVPSIPTYADGAAIAQIAGNGGPILLSVPHSGRDYPQALVDRSRVGRSGLEQLEDPLVDLLVARAIAAGSGAVTALAPRAMIDVNRAPGDLHPGAIGGRSGEPASARARAGLGLIPTRLAGLGDLWRAPIDEGEFQRRLDLVYLPFHAALAERLAALSKRWRHVVLLDCHSMPPRRPGEAQVVIGDRHGTSAAGWLVDEVVATARSRGFAVARNDPFAGGHVIERHGRPQAGVHAIQVEIDRSAYCLRDSRTPGPGFERVAMLFEAIAGRLGQVLGAEQALPAD